MSYKFTLDHTLAIENIHDMITIDIKPDTRCSVTGSDVEIHGYLTLDGSYLTEELGEERFSGQIPLDITLPYLGGAPDVRLEVVSFDYQVAGGESLTLNLEVSLNGYETGALPLDRHHEAIDAWIDPVVSERIIEEAVIEPFDVTLPTNDSTAAPIEPPISSEVSEEEVSDRAELMVSEEVKEEEVSDQDEPMVLEEVKEEVSDRDEPMTSEEVKSAVEMTETSVGEEDIPYSPLVEIHRYDDEEAVENKIIELEKAVTKELPVEVATSEPVEEKRPSSEASEEVRELKLSDSAAALMDELFAMMRGTAFKEQMNASMASPIETPIVPTSVPAQAAYEVAQSDDVEAAYEEARSDDAEAAYEVARNDDVEAEMVEPVVVVDSVARQFADGESTIKMVYVRHESETLGEVLERYSVTMDDVWNLPDLTNGVDVGDCIMIKYEKPI